MNSVSVVASSEDISVVSCAICRDIDVVNACIDWVILSWGTRPTCDSKNADAEVKEDITSVIANMICNVLANCTVQVPLSPQ